MIFRDSNEWFGAVPCDITMWSQVIIFIAKSTLAIARAVRDKNVLSIMCDLPGGNQA